MNTTTLAWLARSYTDETRRYVITRKGKPTVGASSQWACSCPSYTLGGRLCKHLRDLWAGIREGRESARLARLGLACDEPATSFLLRCIASAEEQRARKALDIEASAKGKASAKAKIARLARAKEGKLPAPQPRHEALAKRSLLRGKGKP